MQAELVRIGIPNHAIFSVELCIQDSIGPARKQDAECQQECTRLKANSYWSASEKPGRLVVLPVPVFAGRHW